MNAKPRQLVIMGVLSVMHIAPYVLQLNLSTAHFLKGKKNDVTKLEMRIILLQSTFHLQLVHGTKVLDLEELSIHFLFMSTLVTAVHVSLFPCLT